MIPKELNDWLQVIGLFGVLGGLIFVGLQMRQTQEIALSTAYQARIATSVEFLTSRAANESGLAALYGPQTEEELDRLTPEEQWAGEQLAFALLLIYDNIHFQYERGFIPDEDWQNVLVDMTGAMEIPLTRRTFIQRSPRMRDSFREIIFSLDSE